MRPAVAERSGLHYDTVDDISWWPAAPGNVPADVAQAARRG